MSAVDRMLKLSTFALLAVALHACTKETVQNGFLPSPATAGIDNNDEESGDENDWSLDESDSSNDQPMLDPDDLNANPEGSGNDCGRSLIGVVRDFSSSHSDFEAPSAGPDFGMVAPMLGPDSKPIFVGSRGTVFGADTFAQWFRDTPNVNLPMEIAIPLDDDGVYDNPRFFPADNVGLGNEGREHNYHFTLEIHTEFTYQGGEVFQFRGDDDLFTFVNGHLAIDLGGVHLPLRGEIRMDEVAPSFGMEVGGTYPLDFFFAERHTHLSNFRITTSISCFTPVPIG